MRLLLSTVLIYWAHATLCYGKSDACSVGMRCWGKSLTDTNAICSDEMPNGWNASEVVFEPEWGGWNMFAERSDSAEIPDFDYVPPKRLMVYKFYQAEIWLWFSNDGESLLGYYPPGEGQAIDGGPRGRLQPINILGVTYFYYIHTPYGQNVTANMTVTGNNLTANNPSFIPTGSYTNIPRGTLPSSGYCLPVRLDCGRGQDSQGSSWRNADTLVYDNPTNGLSAIMRSGMSFYHSSSLYYSFRGDPSSDVANVGSSAWANWRDFTLYTGAELSYTNHLGKKPGPTMYNESLNRKPNYRWSLLPSLLVWWTNVQG